MQLVFTPTDWNVPKSFPFYNMADSDDVDDSTALTFLLDGYASGSVTITQLDNG